MNLGTLTTQVSLLAGDPGQQRFQNLYTDAINRAQEQWTYDSKALFKDAPVYTVVAGTSTYSLPTDFMLEKSVVHNGLELKPITRARLQAFSSTDWTLDTGTPKYFIIDPEEGRKQLLLYPNPEAGDAGAVLYLTYYPFVTPLASNSDIPFNSSLLMAQFHMGVAAYAAWLLLGYDSATPEAQIKRSDLMKTYQSSVSHGVETFANTASAPWRMFGGKYFRRDV